MKNKVSIIVPIYNVEKYINKCIKSLISQTYKNIEIMLVDDGTQDNSGKICDEWAKKDKRIKVIHKENGGYGSVLEFAINNIDSEFFLICDGDDWLELNAVERLMKASNKYKVDFVVGRKKLVYSDGKIESDSEYMVKYEYIYEDFNPFLNISCSPHSKLYKTEFCKNIKFPKKISDTDYLLYHIYLTRIKSGVFINEKLSNYFFDRPGNSFNDDTELTEKSVKSQSIVTRETYLQLNKYSKIYPYLSMRIFLRSCRWLALMKKDKVYYKEYEDIFNDIIEKTKENKKYLFTCIKYTTNSNLKCFFKYLVYKGCFSKKTRNIFIGILSKWIN